MDRCVDALRFRDDFLCAQEPASRVSGRLNSTKSINKSATPANRYLTSKVTSGELSAVHSADRELVSRRKNNHDAYNLA